MPSCQKNSSNSEENQPSLDEMLNHSFSNQDGIISFNSEKELKDYYLAIYLAIENFGEDKVMSYLQNLLGHKSLFFSTKSSDLSLRNPEVNLTEEEIINNIKNEFVHDDIRKIILNEDYEVGISGDVHVIFARNQTYKVKNYNYNLVHQLRQIEKGIPSLQKN